MTIGSNVSVRAAVNAFVHDGGLSGWVQSVSTAARRIVSKASPEVENNDIVPISRVFCSRRLPVSKNPTMVSTPAQREPTPQRSPRLSPLQLAAAEVGCFACVAVGVAMVVFLTGPIVVLGAAIAMSMTVVAALIAIFN